MGRGLGGKGVWRVGWTYFTIYYRDGFYVKELWVHVTHARTRTHALTHARTHARTHALTHTHRQADADTLRHKDTKTDRQTDKKTQTHTHTQPSPKLPLLGLESSRISVKIMTAWVQTFFAAFYQNLHCLRWHLHCLGCKLVITAGFRLQLRFGVKPPLFRSKPQLLGCKFQ